MKLKKKLIYWMVGVVTAAIIVMGIVISFWTHHLFADYVDQHFEHRAASLKETLEGYYQQNQSWEGIELLFGMQPRRGMMMGGGPMRGMPNLLSVLAPGERLQVLDAQGNILVDSLGDPARLNQNQIAPKTVERGEPIISAGETVGHLLWETVEPTNVQSLERRFIDSMFKTTLVAVLIIGALAGLIASRVAGRLSLPLEGLTKAALRYTSDRELEPVKLTGDNTEELEQLSRAYNQMVEQINENEKLRRQLVGDIAHELRTPLTVLRCNLESLGAGAIEPTEENMAKLEGEVVRLVGLVEDLQELNLLEQKQSLELKRENLYTLVKGAMDFFQGEAYQREIDLRLHAPEEAMAKVDSHRFTQIMLNLLGNGFRYVPDRGIIEVRLEVAEKSDFWQISISDNGPGIPQEDLSHVFERFYKTDKSRSRGKAKSGGAGLGLAIVKALVEAHGGKISVANKPAGGACFSLTFPKYKDK